MKSAGVPLFACTLALISLALAGCSKNIDNIDAVKQGVLRGIPKDINVGAMDVNVVSVSFRGTEADAVVSFAAKGGPPMMNMRYTMERKGDEWSIKQRASGDGQQHSAQPVEGVNKAGQMIQPAAPGAEVTPNGGTQLPPGHPALGAGKAGPISGDSTQLPPGHPPLGNK